jgi:hypothetical protein
VDLIVGIEQAFCFSDKYRVPNTMPFTLALPPPKAFNRSIVLALHLDCSRPLLKDIHWGSLNTTIFILEYLELYHIVTLTITTGVFGPFPIFQHRGLLLFGVEYLFEMLSEYVEIEVEL